MSAARLAADVRRGAVDPRPVCEEALAAARDTAGVFWELAAERARADAETLAGRLRADAAPLVLSGVPVAVKDAFAVSGLPRHLGLGRAEASGGGDAVAVAGLREAGAIVLGTTAMDQLAWTMTGQAPGYPACENPLVPGRSPGGSSGGAAAAVAAGVVPLALAADSAGSARVPAAWCGAVGFKPSFGAIDLGGCAPLAPCLDTGALIGRDVEDCRVAFGALGPAHAAPAPDRAAPRLGVPAAFVAGVECEAEVVAAWTGTLERLRSARVGLREVEGPPGIPGVGALFAASLARRWGDVVDAEPPSAIHPDVRSGVDYGRSLTDREVLRARDALVAARRRAASLFADVDMLLVPTAPILPPPSGSPAPVRVASAFTRHWSALGCPAISLPCATARVRGCGMQLIARPGDDLRLLRWASGLQDVIGGEA